MLEGGQRFVPVGGLRHHLQVGFGVEDHPQSAAHQRVVVGEQDPRRLGEHQSSRPCSGIDQPHLGALAFGAR